MALRLQFRRYRLPLRTALRTAREVWTEREGLIVRLEGADGHTGYGEVAPIPGFGTETVAEAEAILQQLGAAPTAAQIDGVPTRLGCVRQALAAAQGELVAPAPNPDPEASRGVAALLPAGRAALDVLAPKAEIGFRVFKWKVGVEAAADEIALLDDLCARLPNGAKLRLDANGSWNRRDAERWLAAAADRPIEYIEQPCFAPPTESAVVRRRADDVLLGLANDYPTPIALDESVVSAGDVERWASVGWPGWYVMKPTLVTDIAATLERLRKANATVVFSSALETAVGAKSALRVAFGWTGEPKALGFGVWPLFEGGLYNGPATAPFLRWKDVMSLDREAVWNALR